MLTPRHRWQGLAGLILGLLLASIGQATAAPVVIPGTTVAEIEPPAGFTISDSFAGLENIEDGSSITIFELPPEAYDELSTIFNTEESAEAALLSENIILEERFLLTVEDTQVPVLRGTQQTSIGNATKYITVLEGEKTVLVTFNIIAPAVITQAIVEATITSIDLAAAPTLEEKVAQLSFSFQAIAPFRVSDVFGNSGVLLTTFEEIDPSGTKPIVVIARGQSVVYDRDAEDISAELLYGTRGFASAEIVNQESVEFSGGLGYLIEAEANGLTVVQYTHVPADGRHIRLLATGESSAFADVLSVVKTIADSVTVEN